MRNRNVQSGAFVTKWAPLVIVGCSCVFVAVGSSPRVACLGGWPAQTKPAASSLLATPQSSKPAALHALPTRAVKEGMTIDFVVDHRDGQGRNRLLRAGDNVDIGFTIRDAGSSTPMPGLNPAGWLALSASSPDEQRASCAALVQSALGQTLFSRPEVDLNAYYVLALNADATITVVDPLFGFGETKLLALISLESPGEDWALTSDQNRLLVSMPAANRVAVVDTYSWSVAANVDVGPSPSRIVLQPDEAYAWIATGANAKGGSTSGVAVVDVRTLKVVARIATGRGPHQMAFSDDSRVAFVTNGDEGTVSIIDVRRLCKVKDIAVGSSASSIAFSKLARAAYVTSPDSGTVTGIGLTKQEVIARIEAAPGLGAIDFAADGRLGFAVNPQANTVSIFDTAVNRIVKTARLEKGPDQIAFSRRFAYVRHRESEIVTMIPLDGSGAEGADVPFLDFPGGQHPLGTGSRASRAPAIVRSKDDNAVLVANPLDKAIYYYQEGMAAPMGQFSNYDREPLAVQVVDRGLREMSPGQYRATVRLPAAGQYHALLFINSPRVVHCFDLTVEPGARPATVTDTPSTQVESLPHETAVAPATPMRIAVRLIDGGTGKPVPNVQDLGILVMAPGVWQSRQFFEHERDGVYALTVTPPSPGLYTVYVACPSRQMPYRRVFSFDVAGGAK